MPQAQARPSGVDRAAGGAQPSGAAACPPPSAGAPGLPDQPRPGRRPGPTTTAQTILTQARALFSSRGYASTSLRQIADAAGVDAALIAHFFGSKRGLFDAAIEVPLKEDMPALVRFRTSDKEPVERLATLYVELWSTPEIAQALATIITEAAHDTSAARAMARFMFTWVGQPMIEELGLDQAELRMRLMVGFMGSVALQRQFDAKSMLAALTNDQIVALMVPIMRFILTNPLPPEWA